MSQQHQQVGASAISRWCRVCGAENTSSATVCRSCGRPFTQAAQPPPQQPQQPQNTQQPPRGQPLTKEQEAVASYIQAVTVEIETALAAYVHYNKLTDHQARLIGTETYPLRFAPSKEALLAQLQSLGQKHFVLAEVYSHVVAEKFIQPPQVAFPTHPTGTQKPTQKATSQLPKEGSIIGRDTKTGEIISLPQTDRRRGLYVIGKNGTGKTTFLVNLMLQDIQEGMGLCFLDPHGDAITDILRRLPPAREKDVMLLDVMDTKYPFGLNLYECADPTDLELAARTCEQVMHIFEKVWGAESKSPSWGPAMEDLLRNTALTLIHHQGYTMAELPLLLTDEEARSKMTATLRSTQLRLFWQQFAKRKDKNEYMASTLNKVRAFLSNPIVEHIVGQSHTTIDFRRIMDEGKILLVKLPGRYEDITSLVGAVIIGQLLNAALSRVDLAESKRRQFNLYADEYQRFATPDFASLLAEARKFAIATTIAHQFREQLDSANRGATLNAANMVVFRVSGEDGEELAKEFDATPPPAEVIGQRPILTPKQEVIDHLLKNGHKNPQYAVFTQKYLAGLATAAGMQVPKPQGYRAHTIVGDIMQMKIDHEYQQMELLMADVKVTLQQLNRFLYEVMTEKTPMKPLPPEILLTYIKLLHVENLKQAEKFLRSLTAEQITALCQGQRIVYHGKYHQELEATLDFLVSLRTLTNILAAEPIMADSGQYEPIYDKPRTYADVQNQIATDLANLPAYTAKGKLGHTEVVIRTLPLAAGVSEEVMQDRLATIVGSTKAMYCKPLSKVEEEIATRQEKLVTLEVRKQRTVQEGEV